MEGKRTKPINGLPYVDNVMLILIVLAINLVCAFVIFYGKEIDNSDILVDVLYCSLITSFINVFLVRRQIRVLYRKGRMPREIAESKFMLHMPRNPVLLALVFSLGFGIVMGIMTVLIILLYGLSGLSFEAFLIWKLVYSCLLTAKIMEFAILRYVQKDCREAWEKDGTIAAADEKQKIDREKIKNPIPRLSALSEQLRTVTSDFGLNLITGIFTGRVLIAAEGIVTIMPIMREGVAMSALLSGGILTFSTIMPMARRASQAREEGALSTEGDPASPESRLVSWIPDDPIKFAFVLLIPVMVITSLVLTGVYTLLDFDQLNFFQFFFIRFIYIAVLTRPVVRLIMMRYMLEPDQTKKIKRR
ncbi:MAG: hypothetical protein Q4C25_09415 [Bacillota bacterium]|nr:hypothetical protein [Bacillota bacterium]